MMTNEYRRRWARENKGKVREYNRAYRRRHPKRRSETVINWQLKRKYGITRTQWNEIYHNQLGVCAICLQPETRGHDRLSVDHDHRTGKVRGLLCHRCNTTLGKFEERAWLFERAVAYLRRYATEA